MTFDVANWVRISGRGVCYHVSKREDSFLPFQPRIPKLHLTRREGWQEDLRHVNRYQNLLWEGRNRRAASEDESSAKLSRTFGRKICRKSPTMKNYSAWISPFWCTCTFWCTNNSIHMYILTSCSMTEVLNMTLLAPLVFISWKSLCLLLTVLYVHCLFVLVVWFYI